MRFQRFFDFNFADAFAVAVVERELVVSYVFSHLRRWFAYTSLVRCNSSEAEIHKSMYYA